MIFALVPNPRIAIWVPQGDGRVQLVEDGDGDGDGDEE